MASMSSASQARKLLSDSSDTDPFPAPGPVQVNVQGAFIVPEDSVRPGTNTGYGAEDIRLPNHRGIVSHVAVDIGGSLIKLVYQETGTDDVGGTLKFLNFEVDRLSQCLEFLIQHMKAKQHSPDGPKGQGLCVIATGGGAYKHYDELKQTLGAEVVREDEMECLILGLDFFITEIPREVFSYSDGATTQFVEAHGDIYPYLLVNIGSGVSMIKVSGKREYERVGGTSLGGGTFCGLLSLLTGANTFDEMLRMADRGDNAAVDLLVEDIYGMDYSKIGLKGTVIASSFGKMKLQGETHAENFGMSAQDSMQDGHRLAAQGKPEDISRSLLLAVSNNIAQIAYLQCEKHDLERVYFGGSFIRGHRQTMKTLSYAISFWSDGKKEAYFLRHEGYLGSVGAFINR